MLGRRPSTALLGGGFRAFGAKLGLADNNPVFGLLEWARININAGCGGACGTKIVGESITIFGKTTSRGDSDVTGLTPVEVYIDGQGNVVHIYDKSGQSFWDSPAMQALDASTGLLALQTGNAGDANIAEALAIYEAELP